MIKTCLMSVLYLAESPANGSFIFCNRKLEILAADMIFDEICTAHSPVCLCLIASGLVFMNGKRLHHIPYRVEVRLSKDRIVRATNQEECFIYAFLDQHLLNVAYFFVIAPCDCFFFVRHSFYHFTLLT